MKRKSPPSSHSKPESSFNQEKRRPQVLPQAGGQSPPKITSSSSSSENSAAGNPPSHQELHQEPLLPPPPSSFAPPNPGNSKSKNPTLLNNLATVISPTILGRNPDIIPTYPWTAGTGNPPSHQEPPLPPPLCSSTSNRNSDNKTPTTPSTPTNPSAKTLEIPPPYPWAWTRRATVRPLADLLSNGITTITGNSTCNNCHHHYRIHVDLKLCFDSVAELIRNNLHCLAGELRQPTFPDCEYCDAKNCVVPVISGQKKRNVNWLFLFLGEWIACCSATPELNYFLKHNQINVAQDLPQLTILYTYLRLCQQLCPSDVCFRF